MDVTHNNFKGQKIMPLVIVAIGVVLLLLLMIRFKMNGFIALVLVALAVGLMQGMPLVKVISSIKAGVGGTLGSLALIMGFGPCWAKCWPTAVAHSASQPR
ncbi:Gnt-I system [Leclercia adecarboxylata]|uniref:Gnt-I system n=1 Tax=Leclercia adecarboxylata TaxID=83655 RepID=A0A4U9IXS4_9ENTR|nr:Gnt-I system [Leclercia adecarboxylata]